MSQTAYEYVTQTLELIPEEGETTVDFLVRVAYELQGMGEAEWEALPVSCQEWYNEAAEIIAAAEADVDKMTGLKELPGMSKPAVKEKIAKPVKAKKTVPAVENVEGEAVEGVDGETAEGEATESAEKRGRGRPKGSPSVPKAEKPEKAPKGPIAAASVRQLLCENMDLSLDETMAKLTEMGVEMQRSSVQVNYGLAA